MIVVDVNVIAYLFLPGEHTAKAERLLTHDADWVAPLLWRSEFRNILAGSMRRRMLTHAEALDIQAEAEDLMAGAEQDVDSGQVLNLVRDSKCSAYDCEYVALAMALGVKLVTMDSQLRKSFPGHAIPLPKS
ncbi:MAG: type II toxin-antitoxin system VapC family toxin [Planctomycetia bacterium]